MIALDLAIPPLSVTQAAYAKKSLRRFLEHAWPLIETGPFVGNWHIDALCDLLERMDAGEVPKALVNVPPGTMKSLLVSVIFPAWVWAHNPAARFFCASYGSHVSIRDNLKFRQIVTSDWYQTYYGVTLASDQNAKERFNTTASGWRIATSVGGAGMGEHPDYIIIDDPHTAEQARSDAERQRALDWYQRTVSTRGVARNVRQIVIMQRLHEDDLSGYLLRQGGWEHVCWPMRFDPARADPDDPRETEGELLWPTLFDEAKVRALELSLGPFGAAGQLQQRPAPEGGGLFKRDWFTIVDVVPVGAKRCRGWDTASTDGAGDYTAGVKLAEHQGRFYVESVVHGQWSPEAVNQAMVQAASLDGRACSQREEREPGGAGKAVIAHRAKLLRGVDYRGVQITGDKVTRAGPFRAQCEAGNVSLLRGPWNEMYLSELCAFPVGAHDDQVDASSCAFNELVLANRMLVATIRGRGR